jgi:cobalamin-dependent methionine synthase I
VEGDFHELPTHLAQIIFESENLEVLNFGASTPLHCLAEEVLRLSPEVVCIIATMMPDVERFTRDYKVFTERIGGLGTTVILGGRAFDHLQVRRRFPEAFHVRNFTAALELTRERFSEKLK